MQMKKLNLFSIGVMLLASMSLARANGIAALQTPENQPDPQPVGNTWNLVVWHKDGSKVQFALEDTPKITYEGEKVVVSSSSTVEYDFQAIKKMTYMQEEPNRIGDLAINPERPFTSQGGVITFVPADKDLHVRVATLSGIVVRDFIVPKNEPSSISLTSTPAKVYLISVNGVTYKIAMR